MNTTHYPDLERCKKLTEIGFPKTENVYIQKDLMSSEYHMRERGDYSQYEDEMYVKFVCPSVMEMLDVIPEIEGFWFEIYRHKNDKGEYCVSYEGFEGEETACLGNKFFTGTLPNALADLIFWLHENNYIKF